MERQSGKSISWPCIHSCLSRTRGPPAPGGPDEAHEMRKLRAKLIEPATRHGPTCSTTSSGSITRECVVELLGVIGRFKP
jgi:hypothetical protein